MGFYLKNAGSYYLYGRKIEEWEIGELRNCFSYVSQNVFLLPDSIYENVACGRENATPKEVKAACEAAGIHAFIESLPTGYDTIVGERGTMLSGGERQRISIARAFLKDAPIILLDEPTAAVDVDTESRIQSAMAKVTKGKTVLVIAHRLSTVRQADRIYVVHSGRIAEWGTHAELIGKNGIYAALYGGSDMRMQAKKAKKGHLLCWFLGLMGNRLPIRYNIEGKRGVAKLEKMTFSKAMRLPMSYYEEHHSGDFISRVIFDTERAGDIYGSRLRRLSASVISSMIYFALMFYYCPALTGCLFGGSLLSLAANGRFLKPMKEVGARLAEQNGVKCLYDFLQTEEEPERYAAAAQNDLRNDLVVTLHKETDAAVAGNVVRGIAVEIENISFSYRDERELLRDFSMRVKKGKCVALVGESGCGKSTLAKLLLGFYAPQAGRIEILGKNWKNCTLSDMRRLISYVPQEPYLYQVSIAENIAYGRSDVWPEEVPMEDIVEAAKLANAHDFIMQLPEGYQTIPGERGNTLSGGERQRIAIARAVLKDAPILLLDEATSALDNESERLVNEALDRISRVSGKSGEKTTIMIAHRKSSIAMADEVIAM